MPNRFDLTVSAGAIRLARRWEPDPNFRTRPPMGGGGTQAGVGGLSTAGRVSTTWSKRSQRRMRWEFGALPWELLGPRPAMVTLTYPGEWERWVPDARALVRHREALKERWRRQFGAPVGVWVVEFQKRGAPHLHMYLGLPDAMSAEEYRGLQRRTFDRQRLQREIGPFEARRQMRAPSGAFATWLRTAWWEIVGSQSKAHHGRGVDLAVWFWTERAEQGADRARVAEYLWRESGKWAQKQAPEDFGSLKFYGRWGGSLGFRPVVSEQQMEEQTGYELRRVMRRMQEGKRREAAQRMGHRYRKGYTSRGRDGLTVFEVNGTTWGPRLLAWAEKEAMEKALGASAERTLRYRPGRPFLRAFAELGAPSPDDADELAHEVWLQRQEDDEAAYDRWLAAEAKREAAVDTWLAGS